jgi:preprotein translocase subunit SecF
LFELIKPDTRIDFLGQRRLWLGVSLAVLLAGAAAVAIRGVRTGIDFAGGTELQLRVAGERPVDEGAIRAVVDAYGAAGADVVRFGAPGAREFLVRLPGELRARAGAGAPAGGGAAAAPEGAGAAEGEAPPGEEPPEAGEISPEERKAALAALEAALEEKLGEVEVERVEFVGPRVGAELRRDGMYAMAVSWIAILLYVGFRFSLSYAPGAVVALVHDALVTSGIWVILGLEFDLQVVAALLTIIGYSVNDTIIVYDRIRENMALRTRRELEDVVNGAINQTLSRTLLTSGTTLIALLALLALGGPVIRPFALAMAIGVVVGTYSSIYIASPLMIWLERRRGRKGGPAAARA